MKITGHLCAVTYPEAIDAGIDGLEHGFFVNTQLAPGKQPDICPMQSQFAFVEHVDADSSAAKTLIANSVSHHVSITSTLPIFEQMVPTSAQRQGAGSDDARRAQRLSAGAL